MYDHTQYDYRGWLEFGLEPYFKEHTIEMGHKLTFQQYKVLGVNIL